MPIFDVEIIVRQDEKLGNELASELANSIGEILDSPSGAVWVKVRGILQENYGENGTIASKGNYPVFVSILKWRLPKPSEMAIEVATLTLTIAQVCNRAVDNVHLLYEPEGLGRVAFGGKIITE
jgi:phenylpyruvate tautomerase PptA (4-oxalocrotonate tautomerase family)